MNKPIKIQNTTILMNGIALKTNRGSLGFCNVTLIEDKNNLVLFDTGHYGDRCKLVEIFEKLKIGLGNVKYIILSHLHWDHCSNISLFPEATILLSLKELDYGKKVLEGSIIDNDYPIEIVEHLINKRKYLIFENTFELSSNLSVFESVGHTTGSISLYIKDDDNAIIIAGDAVITGEEFKSGKSNIICLNSSMPNIKESIEKIKKIGKIIIPGHGLPFWNMKNDIKYIGDFHLEFL